MKRLFALLLPLCLLLAGCSRNTQTLQEEVDRLKRENTALLETIDRLQEQLSALQSTSLESWSLEARGADAASPVQILFTARPCARPLLRTPRRVRRSLRAVLRRTPCHR